MNLQELNLAGNYISSPLALDAFKHLHNLKRLILADENYSSSPLCDLKNYQFMMIHEFPNLVQLDQMDLTPEIKAKVMDVMTEKQTFYSMKLHCMKRTIQIMKRHIEKTAKSVDSDITTELKKWSNYVSCHSLSASKDEKAIHIGEENFQNCMDHQKSAAETSKAIEKYILDLNEIAVKYNIFLSLNI